MDTRLSNEMRQALADLRECHPVERGPSYTGIARGTYKALERRGLVEASGKRYRLTISALKLLEPI